MIIRRITILVDRSVNDNFKFNQETEFVPILGLIESQLNDTPEHSDESDDTSDQPVKVAASSVQENHHPALLSVLADELSVASEEIHDFELYVLVIFTSATDILT
jgi:aspartyl aminopeptidase